MRLWRLARRGNYTTTRCVCVCGQDRTSAGHLWHPSLNVSCHQRLTGEYTLKLRKTGATTLTTNGPSLSTSLSFVVCAHTVCRAVVRSSLRPPAFVAESSDRDTSPSSLSESDADDSSSCAASASRSRARLPAGSAEIFAERNSQ